VGEAPVVATSFARNRSPEAHHAEEERMTLIWLVIWFVADQIGGHEPLLFDPVNAWTGTLILAIALDLGASNARGRKST
jgi:hypothetical protein